MLTVNIHLINGDVITTTMTRAQRDRVSKTLNQTLLPNAPFEITAGEADLLIPWRSIGYISTSARAGMDTGFQATEAAD
ncbi:hypothetical protein DAERI_080159 [Deinococcus aerius]|uniref:Uncharacterized protein n=1 Tax=Deinococcus aerius TaxID=200253 RepID=A0A2I9DJ94_9DEIO|nr:hypothetical protein [Deinococcus aerius]GBF06368.1 hypothetical protein DAERI_080159 [Deinococcus aerius]